jgi:hypothetical protein
MRKLTEIYTNRVIGNKLKYTHGNLVVYSMIREKVQNYRREEDR